VVEGLPNVEFRATLTILHHDRKEKTCWESMKGRGLGKKEERVLPPKLVRPQLVLVEGVVRLHCRGDVAVFQAITRKQDVDGSLLCVLGDTQNLRGREKGALKP
jgi:hypothetical protein